MDEHIEPCRADAATRAAVGRLTEALETVERARGHLYSFHQLTGTADAQLQDAVTKLRDAGHGELADRLNTQLVGRNVIFGRWTFQVVEEYDDGYWSVFRDLEKRVRDALLDGRRHLHEAAMKDDERTPGLPGHERRPDDPVP
jgi:hypothetical protein